MVHIILNADDFGRSIERNKAIDDSFKQGLICSAGLIVTGKHLQNAQQFFKAAERAKKAGKLKNFISFTKAASRAMKKAKKFESLAKSGINVAKLAKHFPTKQYLRKYLNITKFKFLNKL